MWKEHRARSQELPTVADKAVFMALCEVYTPANYSSNMVLSRE